jgi:hypothetical protein
VLITANSLSPTSIATARPATLPSTLIVGAAAKGYRRAIGRASAGSVARGFNQPRGIQTVPIL